jgi:putative acetyltransferase
MMPGENVRVPRTPLTIARDDLTGAEIIAFLEAHVAQMRAISPPESTHALDLAGLRAPGIDFWSAYAGGPAGAELVGCVALKRLDASHVELKSMRTATHRLREGIATTVLDHALAEARTAAYARISLETGAEDFFAPARTLYARAGFVECEPFGSYRPDPNSVFMTRVL